MRITKAFLRHCFVALAVLALVGAKASAQHSARYQGQGTTVFVCRVTAVTAATQCQAAPGAGLRAYVTDVTVSNNVGTAQTIKLVTGTGTNCATGTADLTHAVQFGAAVGNWDHSYATPLQPPAAAAICVTPSAATSISGTIAGFIGP
jgi:hypothetical protein